MDDFILQISLACVLQTIPLKEVFCFYLKKGIFFKALA